MIVLSIDSHIPEVFETIRPGSKPELVFENAGADGAALPTSTESSACCRRCS